MYFSYGEAELSYLRKKDKRFGRVIDQIGHIDRERFEKYRRRFSPFGSVASLYLWAVSSGETIGSVPADAKDRSSPKVL